MARVQADSRLHSSPVNCGDSSYSRFLALCGSFLLLIDLSFIARPSSAMSPSWPGQWTITIMRASASRPPGLPTPCADPSRGHLPLSWLFPQHRHFHHTCCLIKMPLMKHLEALERPKGSRAPSAPDCSGRSGPSAPGAHFHGDNDTGGQWLPRVLF